MIYFIHAPLAKKIKIGYTNNDIRQRFSNIQVGSPEKLFVIGLIFGNYDKEKKIHEHYQRYRTHGEWFDDCILTSILNDIRLDCFTELTDYSGIEWSNKFNFLEYSIKMKQSDQLLEFVWNNLKL